MSWRVHRRLGCSQRLPLTGAGTRAFGSFELLDFAGGSAHQLIRRQFTCTCSIVRSPLPPASGARFDLASRDADVLQRAVIELVKRPDGARHRPFFAGFADDAPERFAGSSPHAGTNACFVDRLSREVRASPLEAGLERGAISSGRFLWRFQKTGDRCAAAAIFDRNSPAYRRPFRSGGDDFPVRCVLRMRSMNCGEPAPSCRSNLGGSTYSPTCSRIPTPDRQQEPTLRIVTSRRLPVSGSEISALG